MRSLLSTIYHVNDVKEKPPWRIDVVWSWCGFPEADYCRYTEDLRYSMRSVVKNMPWYNRLILVVRDDFIMPYWMKRSKMVKIVKHHEFIPHQYLPTFNSNVVQSYVHRIKDLTEHFCFLADDMYVGSPTPWRCFYGSSGVPINRHYSGPPDHGVYLQHRIPYVQMWAAAISNHGIHNTRIQHQILPYRRSDVSRYEIVFKKALHRGSMERYRSGVHDFNLLRFTTALTTSNKEAVRVATNAAEWRHIRRPHKNKVIVDFFTESDDIKGVEAILRQPPRFFCINNSSTVYSQVYDALRLMFPEPSPVEKVIATRQR